MSFHDPIMATLHGISNVRARTPERFANGDARARRRLAGALRELVRSDAFGVSTPWLSPRVGGKEIAEALLRHSPAFTDREFFAYLNFVRCHFDVPDDMGEKLDTWRCGAPSTRRCDPRSEDFAERLRRLAAWHLRGVD